MTSFLVNFVRDDRGQDLIEYALLGSFVSLAAYAGANTLGTNLNTWYNSVATAVSNASKKVPVIP